MAESSVRSRVMCRMYVHMMLVLTFMLVGATALGAESDDCFCNELACRPLNCSQLVPDRCGCCLTCVRGLHEPCGGKTRDLGVCADGLQCVIRANPGDVITGHEYGICQELPRGCDAAACDSVITHRCPTDSVLVYNGTHESSEPSASPPCCKTTTECRCDPTRCRVPKCATGHWPQIVRHSTGRPGGCCNHYQCKISGCWSAQGQVYKNGETWKEGDCVTCMCEDGKKQCQAEMCVKTCLNPKYVPGRCCPICDSPILYPNQTSKCADLSTCNITCQTGLQQTPDGCRVCKCKPDDCYKDCQFGYVFDVQGVETCECHKAPPQCPALPLCSKKCSHGYRLSKKGCPKCRCYKCESLNCDQTCFHGYQRDKNGCKTCICQEASWEHNCTVGERRYRVGESWQDTNCSRCTCGKDDVVVCEPVLCPVLSCLVMVREQGQCCPVCLNTSNSPANKEKPHQIYDRPAPAPSSSSSSSAVVDSDTIQKMEEKYVISLSIVGAFLMILLVLVFILLYLKLKQRNAQSWSVAGQDRYCKCPLFLGHSPTLQHKYDITNSDMPVPKYGGYRDTVVVQKYSHSHPCIEVPLEQKSFLPESTPESDYLSDSCDAKLKSNFTYKEDWVEM